MSDYNFYNFTGGDVSPGEGSLLPMPVRQEMERAVFGGDEVRLDLLVDELYQFLKEYPDLWGLYARTLQILAYLAGMDAGKAGDTESAARLLEIGLEADPASLLLRSNYAVTLQLLGKGEEAIEQYEVVLADPEGGKNSMVRLLTAGLYAELGEYLKAYRLLEDMATDLPEDDVFWDFLSEMRELAGVEEEEPGVEAVGEDLTATARIFCTGCGMELEEDLKFCNACGKPAGRSRVTCAACGTELEEGLKFCKACGKPIQGKVEQLAYCPGCGNRLKAGARFCRECGREIK